MAFLSVIIAAHNAGKTLPATLNSLRKASGPALNELEVIIINDSSDDDTQTVIDQWLVAHPATITETVNFKNVGQVRNRAVSLSSGDYITMLDSDDLLKPGSLGDAVDFLKKHSPDMLLTHLLEVWDKNKITDAWGGFSPVSLITQEAIRRFLIHKDFQAHLIGQFIHRDLYQRNPIPALSCYEDFAVFPAMLSQAKRIFFQPSGHYYYIKRKDSLSTVLDASKITHLVDCTQSMENVFPQAFKELINCHWLDIYTNHKQRLNSLQHDTVATRINQLYSTRFFFSKDVRFSYKKRAIKALWKK